jgi:uncharacterized protein YidB (DUF937 family)
VYVREILRLIKWLVVDRANVSNGYPNLSMPHDRHEPAGQLGSALGPDVIKMLAQRSGLSEEQITKQLSQILPGVVDKLTPHGRLPTVVELSQTT